MITRWAPRRSTTSTTTAAAAAVTSLAVRRPATRPHCRPSSSLPPRRRLLSTSFPPRREDRKAPDPRIRDLGRQIADDYATIRDTYATPRHPIVLAHGLLGFSELSISALLPPLQYWHGIRQALTAQGCPLVVAATVPPSSSIEERAAKLAVEISSALSSSSSSCSSSAASSSPFPASRGSSGAEGGARGDDDTRTPVNIIAHSMGGLDARHLISSILPSSPQHNFRVASLVTISTPHRGSPFADYVLSDSRRRSLLHLPRFYSLFRAAGLSTRAFAQLGTRYLADDFNPANPDDPAVRYFSYGAALHTAQLPMLSPFRLSHGVIREAEGANDGLVSVESSRWGEYKGTLLGVSHLDLINWPNKVRWTVREWMGIKRNFNAVAFYLDIAEMLAKEGY
ncbi:hypothetical protein PLIIFM63780_010196 [Purpureocillium lilacinum]|nr:hypothetical protein PLIIFM63780_010196 [Purpureocillium lilacinum]